MKDSIVFPLTPDAKASLNEDYLKFSLNPLNEFDYFDHSKIIKKVNDLEKKIIPLLSKRPNRKQALLVFDWLSSITT